MNAYSMRQHSYHSDSLNAILGVLSLINASYKWHFINALPEDVFDLALLWRPLMTAELRPRESSEHSRRVSCRESTWCSTSWVGNIYWDHWRLVSYAGHIVSLQPAVEQFVIASPNGFRTIRNWKTDTNREDSWDILNDARNYVNEHEISWNESDGEIQSPWDMVLFFKASATDLSRLSRNLPPMIM